MVGKFRPASQPLQGPQLRLQCLPVVQGVDIGGLLLKVTVNMAAQRPVVLEDRLVGGEILPRPVNAKGLDELVVDESVLTGQLGGGVPGCPAAQGVGRLRQHIGDPGLLEHPRAQDAHYALPMIRMSVISSPSSRPKFGRAQVCSQSDFIRFLPKHTLGHSVVEMEESMAWRSCFRRIEAPGGA